MGQEVLKVVKVLHLGQLHTHWKKKKKSDYYEQQVNDKIHISET